MAKIKLMPCVVCCWFPVGVHHAGTGAGGRKDHMKVLPLCETHHTGKLGIHTIGRRAWQARFGTESELLQKVERKLNEND